MQILRSFWVHNQIFYVVIRLALKGFLVWPSWSGWGIVLDWPFGKWEKQLDWLRLFLKERLPETYLTHGPTHAAGGAMVMYLWRQDDYRVIIRLHECAEESSVSLDLKPKQTNAELAIS